MSSRPNRSDVHLSPEDEAAREAEVRGYFDDAAPKRHTKPSRSEHSAVYADAIVPDSTHPELDKFQDLEAHTEVSPLDPRPPQLPLSLEPELLQAAYTYEFSLLRPETGVRGRQGRGGVRGDGVLQGSRRRRQAAPHGHYCWLTAIPPLLP
jgi:hypothetical protein